MLGHCDICAEPVSRWEAVRYRGLYYCRRHWERFEADIRRQAEREADRIMAGHTPSPHASYGEDE